MGRCFGSRPVQMHIFAQDELERANQRSLHRRNVDLAVALPGMAVAHQKQCAPSTSPGSAPSMKIGPVRMGPPGPLFVTSLKISRSDCSTSAGFTPAPSSRVGLDVISVWTSTVSPDLMRNTGGVLAS